MPTKKQIDQLKPSAKKILSMMQKGWTSPLQIFNRLHIFSVNARISEIRKAGYVVESKSVMTKQGKRHSIHRIKK
jgi:hypothetical protein